MQDAREVSRLWRVYRTVHEMMHIRGYKVSPSELQMDIDTFRTMFAPGGTVDRTKLTSLVQGRDDPTDQVYIFFPDDKSVGIKPIREFCERMVSQNVQRGIIVYRDKVTGAAKKAMEQFEDKYKLDLFSESELLVNITKHRLVPKHEVLSQEETETLLKRYRLKVTQLPRIQHKDPIARFYGLSRGQVVKITRASETAGRYLTYRYCM